MKNIELNEETDESDLDLEILEPVKCMESPKQFNDWTDLGVHLKEAQSRKN